MGLTALRRFYKEASAVACDGGFGILLDSKPLKTPARHPLVLPTRALAEAIAAEWRAQEQEIRPLSMPLMRLAATAIDRIRADRQSVVDEIAAYAGTDLVSYRAEGPPELVARQEREWQPLLDWLRRRYDVHLQVTRSVVPIPQAEGALARFRSVIAARDDFALAALHALTTNSGSLVIALAVAEGEIDAATGFRAGHLDELYQASLWGEDAEAAERRKSLAEDMESAARFLALSRG